tara:strand:+ start:558 stop:755 length:198 start_codon:yes stop_codon:yes gene_type:complete
MNITKDMTIEQVIKKYPDTIEVFVKHGFHCLGCSMASMETLEQGCEVHEIDVEKFLKELNDAIKN